MPSWMKWAVALAIGFAIIGIGFRLSWGGTWILKPFFILNCLVLVVVVLLQSGKAADLAGAFGGAGSQTAFGPRGAANVLSKATTTTRTRQFRIKKGFRIQVPPQERRKPIPMIANPMANATAHFIQEGISIS